MVTVDDGLMTAWKQVLAWASAITCGLALVGLGVFFVIAGLDDADKLASVIGGFAALIGLGLSVYGVVLTRRTPARPLSPGLQRVDHVDAGRGVDVVDTVAGNVRLGLLTPPPAVPPAALPAPTQGVSGEQSVTNVRANGAIRVIRGVGGDVELS